MASKRPLAIAILTWTALSLTLDVLSFARILSPGWGFYANTFVGSVAVAVIYWVLSRLVPERRGARLFLAVAAVEGVTALIGVAAFTIPGAAELVRLPQPLTVVGIFDLLGLVALVLTVIALLWSRVVPWWVPVLRSGVLIALVVQDVWYATSYTASAGVPPAWWLPLAYATSAFAFAYWAGLGVALLRQSHTDAADGPAALPHAAMGPLGFDGAAAGAGRGESALESTTQSAGIVLVMLLLAAAFPLLIEGTVRLFHGFNFDLALNVGVAVVAYGLLWVIGARLDSRYRRIAAASMERASGRPSVPRTMTDTYGLLLIGLLPLLLYLFVLALYGVELLITEALIAMDAIQVVPTLVIGGLLIVAVGSVWGVALGVWRLAVPAKKKMRAVELPRSSNSRLWSVVDDVARDSGTKTVDHLWVAADAGIGVWEDGSPARILRGDASRSMTVGLAAVHDMTVAEFKSILRHEFAHLSNRDTAWGSFTYSMSRSLLAAWKATPGGNPFKANSILTGVVDLNPAWWVYWLFVRLFSRATAGFSRVREMVADWDAVSYAGGDCFASGLTKVIVNEKALRTWLTETQVEKGSVPNVAEGVARTLASMTPEQLQETTDSALAARVSKAGVYNTHPDPQTRLAYARRAGTTDLACSQEPVSGLFDAWEDIDARASRAMLAPNLAS